VTGRSLKEVELTAVKKSAGTTKAVPAKKAASRPATATKAAPVAKAAPARKSAPAATAAARSKSSAAKSTTTTSKTTTSKNSAKKSPAKSTPATSSKAGAAKKSVPAATKAAAAAKPPAKKAASVTTAPAKKAASAAAAPAAKAPAVKATAVKKAAPEPPKRPTVGPYAKDIKFLDAQRVLLHEERVIYAGQAIDLRAEADSLALEREPGDVQFDEESGEGGTVTVDRERNLALSAQATAAVEEIDDALRKLDRKTYGWCERCYQPIPKARLQALPFARLCVACKSGGLSRR
jgi:DnaK suppressor protein